jgi:hypothetical protein
MAPGEHNVCTEWQSHVFKKTSDGVGGAISLNLEVTKASGRIKLDLSDNAEGQFLLSSSALSNSHPKR